MGQTDIVRLPAAMVEEAMAQITKSFDLVHPGGARMHTPDGRQHAGVRLKMPKVLDYGAREFRPPCRQDVIDLSRIMNALPGAEFSVAIQYPCSDVPPQIDVADTLGLVLAVTGKLSLCAPQDVDDARTSLDVLMAGAGTDDMERDPCTWVEINTTTPLTLGAREGDIVLHVVGRRLPHRSRTHADRRRGYAGDARRQPAARQRRGALPVHAGERHLARRQGAARHDRLADEHAHRLPLHGRRPRPVC